MNWHSLTSLGAAALVWPAVLLAALLLARSGRDDVRASVTWVLCLATASATVAMSKIGFYGWGTGVRAWNLTCFSGHSVLAMGFWPVFLGLLVSPSYPRWRISFVGIGVLLGALVVASRVAVRAHPISEALAGALLGAVVASVAIRAFKHTHLPLRKEMLLIVLIWWSGEQFNRVVNTEHVLRQVAVALSGNAKPYTRKRWLRHTHSLKAHTPKCSMSRLSSPTLHGQQEVFGVGRMHEK
jgi:hypothetical protein